VGRVCITLIVLSVAAVGAPAADAAVHGPARGKVFHSGLGGYGPGAVNAFTAQSGKHPAVYQYFVSWKGERRDLNFIRGLLESTSAARSRTALAVSTNGTGLTPAAIARGEGDRFLVGLNAILGEHGSPTYLRLLSEMNNGANSYSAYDPSGRSRGPAYSTRQFKRAWRRAVLVLRGGTTATIDAKLRRLGMPAVRTGAAELASPAVSFQWVPLTFGNPETARNHPRHWWPGSRYVDWVGTTWYSPFLTVSAFDRFYRYRLWRKKPFVFGEYGVWGAESPHFISLFFRFLKTHRRVRMASYYQSAMLKPQFRLASHPRSRATLRRKLRSSRFVAYAPEFASR
jgi:hypothetical protein